MITIALPNDYGASRLLEKLKALGKYKYMSKYIFNIEYFSKTGENMHAHILVPNTLHKTKTIRDFSRWFGIEPNFIDVRKKNTELQYKNALAYVMGEKVDEDKKSCVEKDIIWRKENLLENYYLIE